MNQRDFKTHFVTPKEDKAAQALRPSLTQKSKKIDSEIEEAREKHGQLGKRQRSLDELTRQLEQPGYVSKPYLHWLVKTRPRYQPVFLSVSRYYPNLKLLIDVSLNEPADSDENCEAKDRLAKENGHTYFNLKTQDDIARMFLLMPAKES